MLTYFTRQSQCSRITQRFTGVDRVWYFFLALPFVIYPICLLLTFCFTNRGPIMLVGLVLMVGFRTFHPHRINHISRWLYIYLFIMSVQQRANECMNLECVRKFINRRKYNPKKSMHITCKLCFKVFNVYRWLECKWFLFIFVSYRIVLAQIPLGWTRQDLTRHVERVDVSSPCILAVLTLSNSTAWLRSTRRARLARHIELDWLDTMRATRN